MQSSDVDLALTWASCLTVNEDVVLLLCGRLRHAVWCTRDECVTTAIWRSAVVGENPVLHFNSLPVNNNEKDFTKYVDDEALKYNNPPVVTVHGFEVKPK